MSQDFYHDGICCMSCSRQAALIDDFGNWTILNSSNQWNDYFKRITVCPVYYIPFSKIINYDLGRNGFDDGPFIFCKFDGIKGSPYEKIEYRIIREDQTFDFNPLPEKMRFNDSFLGWKKLYLRRFFYKRKKLLRQ